MKLPAAKDFGWNFKSVAEAHSTISHLPDGRTLFEVEHPVVRGITVEMLEWWYGVYADLNVVIAGETVPAFRLSHPRDHIHLINQRVAQGGPLEVGDVVKIAESYQRNPKYITKEFLEVTRRDGNGFALKAERLGVTVADIEYQFWDVEGGVQIRNLLTVGVVGGALKPLINRVFVPWLYNEDKTYAWVIHCVEEIGNFENFLSELYVRRDQGMTITWEREVKQRDQAG